MSHVFVSHVHDDAIEVNRLVFHLRAAGIDVWLDRDSIKAGDRWRDAIRAAIQDGAFFIACFSRSYSARSRTFMNEELTIAVEELRLRPRKRTWFLPVLLDDGEVPDLPIGFGETLLDIQTTHLRDTWEDGLRRLISVIIPSSSNLNAVRDGTSLRMASSSASHVPDSVDLKEDLSIAQDLGVARLLRACEDQVAREIRSQRRTEIRPRSDTYAELSRKSSS